MKSNKKIHQKAVNHLVDSDEVLKQVIRSIGDCGLDNNKRDPFDVLASSIMSQQLSKKAATTIMNRVLVKLNKNRPLSPSDFVNVNKCDLRTCGLSNAKSDYILELSSKFIKDKIDNSLFEEMDDAAVINELTKLKGIGQWTSEMFLIFSLGRKDVLSLTDAGLRRAVTLLYGLKNKPTDNEFIEIAEYWRPYRSIASWYLWGYIDQ